MQTSLSILRPPAMIDLNVTSTQKLPFQQNIVYIPPTTCLEQLTSFPQTTFPAAGYINLHATINQINATIFEHDLKEIKTDQIVLTLVQLSHPKLSKYYGCGTLLKPNKVIPETPNDLVFISNTLREYKDEDLSNFLSTCKMFMSK